MKKLFCFASALLLIGAGFPKFSANAEEKKYIALTFDDGPNTTTTTEILDILEEYGAKGSFFLIGNNINDASAESVKRAYSMGCEIDNHSKSHPNMGGLSEEEIKKEVGFVDEKVYEITGEYPKFFRPPFIDTSETMYKAIDVPFICGIDCQDYMENVSAEERAQYILDGAKDGSIFLLHDAAGNSKTVEALRIAMPQLVSEGYEFVTLSELFEKQGETPKEDMIYTYVTKYPLKDYEKYSNLFSGNAQGEPSWNGWHDTAVLDGKLLEELGDSYAIQVDYLCEYEPVIALQKWSGGASIWQPVKPSYFNGEKACFLAADVVSVLDSLDVSYTDLDRMVITPYGGNMTITNVDIMVKSGGGGLLRGDVNADGKVTIADGVMMTNWLLGDGELMCWQNGDLCEDGKVDIFDMVEMRKLITED